jgi:hypothetical protein
MSKRGGRQEEGPEACEKCGGTRMKTKLFAFQKRPDRFERFKPVPPWPGEAQGTRDAEALEVTCACGHRLYRPTLKPRGAEAGIRARRFGRLRGGLSCER